MNKTLNLLLVAGLLACCLLIALMVRSHADDNHQHPASDIQIHNDFYSKWQMPPLRKQSCCDKKDCYPTPIKFEDGRYYAKRREDGKWLVIRDDVLEQNQEADNQHHSPDHLSHACILPPDTGNDSVLCATIGSGQ